MLTAASLGHIPPNEAGGEPPRRRLARISSADVAKIEDGKRSRIARQMENDQRLEQERLKKAKIAHEQNAQREKKVALQKAKHDGTQSGSPITNRSHNPPPSYMKSASGRANPGEHRPALATANSGEKATLKRTRTRGKADGKEGQNHERQPALIHSVEGSNGTWKHTYPDGEIFEGKYKNGLEDVTYKETFANGNIHEGKYKNGEMHGDWKLTYADGAMFEGKYKNGLEDGYWKELQDNGHIWEGPYKNGERQGTWKHTLADGEIFEGPYENGKRHGTWKLTYDDGVIWETPFNNGQRETPFNNGQKEGPIIKTLPSKEEHLRRRTLKKNMLKKAKKQRKKDEQEA